MGGKPLVYSGVGAVGPRAGEVRSKGREEFCQLEVSWVSDTFFNVLTDYPLVFLVKRPLRVKDKIPGGTPGGEVLPKQDG